MSVVFPRVSLDQWISRRAKESSEGPSLSSPHLDMFRPKTSSDLSPWRPRTAPDLAHFSPKSSSTKDERKIVKLEIPTILCSTDRGGLQTWLATRKAESDKKLVEKEGKKENIWLARETTEPASSTSRVFSVKEGLNKAGEIKERVKTPISEIIEDVPAAPKEAVMESVIEEKPNSVRMSLLKAWGSVVEKENIPEKAANEKVPIFSCPLFQKQRKVQGPLSRDLQSWVPGPCSERRDEKIQPIGNQNLDNVFTNSGRSFCRFGRNYENRERNVNSPLTNSWLAKKEDKTILPVETRNESLRKSLLSAWAGCEKEDVPVPVKEKTPTREEDMKSKLRMSLMNLWKEAEQDEEQSWDGVDDTTESEASIVTLDTMSDPSDEFDDFSDMQLELAQWISK